jgi:hypothetical protein
MISPLSRQGGRRYAQMRSAAPMVTPIAGGGTTASAPISATVFISIAGVEQRTHVLMDSINIADLLDERPNTCTFTAYGITPTCGQEVIVALGSLATQPRLFAGYILNVTCRQRDWKSPVLYDVSCIDYTWKLNHHKVTNRYTNQSATAIVLDLMTTYGTGFTVVGVQAGLEALDEITFTNEDLTTALTRIAKRIGGYWYVDYNKDLHFWVGTEGTVTNPADLTLGNRFWTDLTYQTDMSQQTTQWKVEGGGVNALTEVSVGETILPVEDAAWYEPAGGVVVSGPQHITYTGVTAGGGGGLVGPGASPSGSPAAANVAGAGVTTGMHDYAVTFVTAAGESLPGPRTAISVGGVPTTPVLTRIASGGGTPSETGSWTVKVTWLYASGAESLASAASNAVTITGPNDYLSMTIAIGPAGVTKRRIYYKPPSSGVYKAWSAIWDIPNNTATTATTDAQMNGTLINEPSTGLNQVNLTGIPIGPSGTTQRKVYRTVAAGSQLKLQSTIANNTATTATDNVADGSLGANAPVTDTSGIAQPAGFVLGGETTLIVAGTGGFSGTGGWAVIGNGQQVIRYTGVSSTALTGVPATGAGAIAASVGYNTTVTAAPQLTGIPASGAGSIRFPILKGDPVNVLVTVNDVPAQTALATLIGGDGIIEDFIQDRRLSVTEARARGEAMLDLRSTAEISLRYRARDTNSTAGRTITLNVAGLAGAFKIQQVNISEVGTTTAWPAYDVTASTTAFSFEDLLRLVRKG